MVRMDPATRVVTAFGAAAPRCGGTKVLAIDGPSGSGKTALAVRVADALGLDGDQIVSLDRLYPGWDGLAAGVELLVDDVLGPLARGRPGSYRAWDWARDRPGAQIVVPVTDLLLVEGCGATAGAAGGYAALRVWVEAPPAVRYRRAMARDVIQRCQLQKIHKRA